MRNSMASAGIKNKYLFILSGSVLFCLILLSLSVGKYPFSWTLLLSGDEMQRKAFRMLRVGRTVTALCGGFVLGASGFVYQTVFKNPLASPDIIGVSSGASAGAAVGILFFGSTALVTGFAFSGAVLAVLAAVLLSSVDKSGRKSTIVLAGIAVHSLAQAALMVLKLLADPEKELSSIEFWIMGSLAGVRASDIGLNLCISVISMLILLLLHRQLLLLSIDEGEAELLGVRVFGLRLIVLLTATLSVAATVSLTGLISFIGLLAPHAARLITKDNRQRTFVLSGVLGSALLLISDVLARSVSEAELPVSIFTSLIGAPFLIALVLGKKDSCE